MKKVDIFRRELQNSSGRFPHIKVVGKEGRKILWNLKARTKVYPSSSEKQGEKH